MKGNIPVKGARGSIGNNDGGGCDSGSSFLIKS